MGLALATLTTSRRGRAPGQSTDWTTRHRCCWFPVFPVSRESSVGEILQLSELRGVFPIVFKRVPHHPGGSRNVKGGS